MALKEEDKVMIEDARNVQCVHGKTPTYVVIMCDTFSYETYPVKVYSCCGKSLDEIKKCDKQNMQDIMHVDEL